MSNVIRKRPRITVAAVAVGGLVVAGSAFAMSASAKPGGLDALTTPVSATPLPTVSATPITTPTPIMTPPQGPTGMPTATATATATGTPTAMPTMPATPGTMPPATMGGASYAFE